MFIKKIFYIILILNLLSIFNTAFSQATPTPIDPKPSPAPTPPPTPTPVLTCQDDPCKWAQENGLDVDQGTKVNGNIICCFDSAGNVISTTPCVYVDNYPPIHLEDGGYSVVIPDCGQYVEECILLHENTHAEQSFECEYDSNNPSGNSASAKGDITVLECQAYYNEALCYFNKISQLIATYGEDDCFNNKDCCKEYLCLYTGLKNCSMYIEENIDICTKPSPTPTIPPIITPTPRDAKSNN